jgi:hypothetical protein
VSKNAWLCPTVEALWAGVLAPFEIVDVRNQGFQFREATNNFGDRRWALSLLESKQNHMTQFR